MYHAKTSEDEMQEEILEALRLPLHEKYPTQKIKKEDIAIQFQELLKFLQGDYLEN